MIYYIIILKLNLYILYFNNDLAINFKLELEIRQRKS